MPTLADENYLRFIERRRREAYVATTWSDNRRMTVDPLAHQTRLLQTLVKIGFAEAYYACCDAHPRGISWEPTPEAVAAVLARTDLTFKYKKGERVFSTAETIGTVTVGLNLRVAQSTVEAVLLFKTVAGHLGSPFAGIARDVMLLSNPEFDRSPPYPRPWYSDQAGIDAILPGLVTLFKRSKAELLLQPWND